MFSFFKKNSQSINDLSWLGVDIHSHLLPGIDDGAPDLATSMRLIEGLTQLGIKSFYCTPHILKELYPNTRETINNSLQLISDKLEDEKLGVEIYAAAEYMIDDGFIITDELLCLKDKYLLIEMSYLAETPNIDQIIFNLQIKGYVVILAHPERYNFYHLNLDRYQRLKELGCLFQLNLLSVTGYYGKEVKKIASYLLKNNLYDLAGTDLHHDKHLSVLKDKVRNGELYKAIGSYPFKNKKMFGNM